MTQDKTEIEMRELEKLSVELEQDAMQYVELAHKKLEDKGLPLPETEIFIAGALFMRVKAHLEISKLQAKVQELESQVSHLEGVSDGYAVVEMEDKAKIKSLQSELSALKAENEKLKEFERKRWESAVGTLGITPPKPEEGGLSDKEQK